MNDEKKKDLVLDEYNKTINDSFVDFEKQLTFIASGALGISVIFIEKIVDLEHSVCNSFLILGWVFFGLSLVLNMSSHLLTILFCSKSAQEYVKGDSSHNDKVEKRNKTTMIINLITAFFLLLGLSGIIIFLSINLDTKKLSSESNIKKCFDVSSNYEQIEKEI